MKCKYCNKDSDRKTMKKMFSIATTGSKLPDDKFFCMECGCCYDITVKKLSIIIPVYNEERYFDKIMKKVLDVKLPDDIHKEIIIVESNSTDGTKEIVRKYAEILQRNVQFKIIFESRPRGKGYAVRTGLRYATGDVILIQDADLEYDPDEYSTLLQPIIDNNADFVLGSRHLGAETWKIRKFDYSRWYARLVNVGSEVLNSIFALLYNIKLTDPQTMFKVFRRDCINGIKFKSNHFQLDWEIVIKLCKNGYIPIEIPVSYKARTLEQGKKIRLSRDGFLALWTIIKYRFVD